MVGGVLLLLETGLSFRFLDLTCLLQLVELLLRCSLLGFGFGSVVALDAGVRKRLGFEVGTVV
jgi:hypothetical protein